MATLGDFRKATVDWSDDTVLAFEWDGQGEFANSLDLWSGQIAPMDDLIYGRGLILRSQDTADRKERDA